MNIGFKAAQANFFDREKVIRAVDRAKLRYLKESGRLVRKTAQRSLRYVKNYAPSLPGRPPNVHKTAVRKRTSKSTGKTRTRPVSPLREFLFFSYDGTNDTVVIGPARLNGVSGGNVPAALEYGATSTTVIRGQKTRIRIAPRPFMRPALAEVRPDLPALWRDSVR